MLRMIRAQGSEPVKTIIFCAFIFNSALFCADLGAQSYVSSENLFSPSASLKFHEAAYYLADSEKTDAKHSEQALIFLKAAIKLNGSDKQILEDMIEIASRYSEPDRSELVKELLLAYVDKTADLETASKPVRYLLENLDTRQEREELLADLIRKFQGKNDLLYSELITELGLLKLETSDPNAAGYFGEAYEKNKYNSTAFNKLVELVPQQINPAMDLEHLRLALSENPFDIEISLGFALFAERLELYEVAAGAYEYSYELFKYLYGAEEPIPPEIYLPWSLSCYNTVRHKHKCLGIAEIVRSSDSFDLLVECIAAKASLEISGKSQAESILTKAERKALELAEYSARNRDLELQISDNEQLAWFYSFIRPDANMALEKANKAYSIDANSSTAASLLAYSLMMNGQADLAESLVSNYEDNQISALVLAQIQQDSNEIPKAIETLKTAIALDPGSLEAEKAKEILEGIGGEYIPMVDSHIALTLLKNSFADSIVPDFVVPEKIITAKLNFRGSSFSYGSRFGCSLSITNNSSEPLVVSESGLLNGKIRIDAEVSGDINEKIPELVSMRIRPSLPIEPGNSLLVQLRLVAGRLREILLNHPQASVNIELTAYLDPVINEAGELSNRLESIEPAKAVVKRPGVILTGKYLQNQLNSFTKGKQGQKIKTAQLFAGLLKEQHFMANREPLYKFVYADWMPAMLKSALVYNLAGDDWVAKVHTTAAMIGMPLDYELISALSENLNDNHWPVRLMAVFILGNNPGVNFDKVLDWTAKNDTNQLVQAMANTLITSKTGPEPEEKPAQTDLEE